MANARFLLQNYRVDDLRAALSRRGLSDAGTALEVAERVAANRIAMPVSGPPARKAKKAPASLSALAAQRPAASDTDGRCLSVRQPWATLIVLGAKKVENRSWKTDYRGRLFIHASASRPAGSWSGIIDGDAIGPDEPVTAGGVLLPAWSSLPVSAVVGSVELYDCVDEVDLPPEWDHDPFVGGPYCWLLRDPRPLATPFPCKGALRLWAPPAGLLD